MPTWLVILDGVLWLFLVTGLAWLIWQHREEFNLSEANAPADPRFYVGPFYNNPTDSRLLVPKPFGPIELGWTLNLAHPHAKQTLALLLGGIAVLVLIPPLLVH
jgi:uncharacterized membrane protein